MMFCSIAWSVPFIIPMYQVSDEVKGLEPAQDMKEDREDEDIVPRQAENVGDMKPAKDDMQLNLTNESEELKSKLSVMDSKLRVVRAHEFRLHVVAIIFMSTFLVMSTLLFRMRKCFRTFIVNGRMLLWSNC